MGFGMESVGSQKWNNDSLPRFNEKPIPQNQVATRKGYRKGTLSGFNKSSINTYKVSTTSALFTTPRQVVVA